MDSLTNRTDFPRLRNIDVSPVMQDGRAFLLINDPFRLYEKQLLVPHAVGPILQLCDGTRDAEMICTAYGLRYGQSISIKKVEEIIAQLDLACLLVNDRSQAAEEALLASYREGGVRTALLAGISYPDNREELQAMLNDFSKEAGIREPENGVRGLLSPHIDYERGGISYAKVWNASEDAVVNADLAIILGTDHYGRNELFTLTRADFITPFGTIPAEIDKIDRLASVLGENAYRGELRHTSEHSIELAAIWLQYMRGGTPCPFIPVLCGSVNDFFGSTSGPMDDFRVREFIQMMREIAAEESTVVIAAGDLSHVGPAFGGNPIRPADSLRLKEMEEVLIDLMCTGEVHHLFNAVGDIDDRTNICGLAPIYHTMQILEPLQGTAVAYEQCVADREGTSLVSISGIVFK